MRISKPSTIAAGLLASGLLAACGGPSSLSSTTTGASSSSITVGGGATALSAESRSLATGDIPDNQVFLTFHNSRAGYSLRYPEGWAQQGAGNVVTFTEKNNTIRLLLTRGANPTTASALAELARERARQPSLRYGSPQSLTIGGAPVLKVDYSTLSPPNPVTGKRVRLLVDRYVYAHGGRVATLDLGTPQGVDNVDAYKLISKSFRWY